MLLPVAGFVAYAAWRFFATPRPAAPAPQAARVESRVVPAPQAPAAARPAASPSRRRGKIVLILDDVGFDRQPLAAAMKIDPNLSFSILPNATNAAAVASTLHERGFEILCHLPMEPVDYPRMSPGANAVMTSMSDDEIARTTREDIGAVPHAVGVNNHMGSRATRDARVMTSVLTALPKGMYFIDSRTTSGSVAGPMARRMNIPTASRQVFLDDVQNEGAIRRQLAGLAAAAEEQGIAVGIGHMYPPTIRVLAAEVPQLRARGFRIVRASEAVE
jgi:polysaccharide deacetylase 2 family uncharacterized protein YibQ